MAACLLEYWVFEVSPVLDFIKQNIGLVLLVVVSGIMVVWPELKKMLYGSVNEIGTLDATQLMNRKNAIVLDVREGTEFASGHIKGARNIPLSELDARVEELKKFKEKPIIISCRTGARSSSAIRALRKHEFAQVFSLKGGLAAWEQASLPLDKSS
jgi:rhodanese-related sulfurtransferase